MALQTIKHGLPFPVWPVGSSGAPSLTFSTMDAAGEKLANVFRAPVAKSIRKVHIRTMTVTTGGTLDVRIETVSAANGDPTGTLWGTNTNGSLVVADTDDTVWLSVTLTADATLAVGDVFAIVLALGGTGNMQIAFYSDNFTHSPYSDAFLTAAWVKAAGGYLMVVEYSDGSFEALPGYFDVGGILGTAFNSGTATNRRGNIFQVPFPTRAIGCWAWVDADGDFTVKLYDSDGTSVLATTATIDTDQRGMATPGMHFVPFTAPATLLANTNYRIQVVPGTVTNLTVHDFDVSVAGMLDMFPGGQNCHRSVFTSSAWVETTTARTYLGVFLDQFDDGAGGGGGSTGSIFSTPIVRAA